MIRLTIDLLIEGYQHFLCSQKRRLTAKFDN